MLKISGKAALIPLMVLWFFPYSNVWADDKISPDPVPVYVIKANNQELVPYHNAENRVLNPVKNGEELKIHFFIAPDNDRTPIPGNALTSEKAESIGKNVVNITVPMFCGACSNDRMQTVSLTYFKDKKRSTDGVFTIVPDASVPKDKWEHEYYITFTPLEKGLEMDHLVYFLEIKK